MDNFIIDAPLDYDEEELEEMRKNASSYSGSSDLLDRRDGFDTALAVLDATQVNINFFNSVISKELKILVVKSLYRYEYLFPYKIQFKKNVLIRRFQFSYELICDN